MTASLPNETTPAWQERVTAKRQECHEAIPTSWLLGRNLIDSLQTPWEDHKHNMVELNAFRRSGILSDREVEITEQYSVAELIESLSSGQITALEATLAFSKRAAIAQQLTNCLTETYFLEAQERAKKLDALREQGKLSGPLHGLPISLKDCFQIQGSEATIGMVAFLGQKSSTNSALVDVLTNLGAVLYCKTNVPQTMMTAETNNNVFGRTLNPWNTALGAGGSSGGEGALVALRGSPIGVGTDIGGSIRIPALCCGTYGFRPTAGRIPFGKQRGCANPGFRPILSTAGPLANDVDALGIFMKAVLSTKPRQLDSTVIDVPWRQLGNPSGRKLRLGLLAEDPKFPLHPPVRAALDEAVRLLEAQGHQVIRLTAEDGRVDYAGQVSWGLLTIDDTAIQHVLAAGEAPIPSLPLLSQTATDMGLEHIAEVDGLDALKKFAALNIKRAEIVDGWNKVWVAHGLDAVISPAAQNSAVEHDQFNFPPYSVFLNLLDYPACIIPFGKVAGTEIEFKVEKGHIVPPFKPELLKGAPLSVQVFTSSMRDEECLDISKVVDQCLRQGDAHLASF